MDLEKIDGTLETSKPTKRKKRPKLEKAASQSVIDLDQITNMPEESEYLNLEPNVSYDTKSRSTDHRRKLLQ